MLAAANAQFAGNVAQRDEMVALNPYKPGLNICRYCVVARLTVDDGIHISFEDSVFTHSDSCSVVAGKVTSKMLLKETSFVVTVANFGFRWKSLGEGDACRGCLIGVWGRCCI